MSCSRAVSTGSARSDDFVIDARAFKEIASLKPVDLASMICSAQLWASSLDVMQAIRARIDEKMSDPAWKLKFKYRQYGSSHLCFLVDSQIKNRHSLLTRIESGIKDQVAMYVPNCTFMELRDIFSKIVRLERQLLPDDLPHVPAIGSKKVVWDAIANIAASKIQRCYRFNRKHILLKHIVYSARAALLAKRIEHLQEGQHQKLKALYVKTFYSIPSGSSTYDQVEAMSKHIPDDMLQNSLKNSQIISMIFSRITENHPKRRVIVVFDREERVQAIALVSFKRDLLSCYLKLRYIATAYWNLQGANKDDPRRVWGAGTAAVEECVFQSFYWGCKGRIALSACENAQAFYEKLGFQKMGVQSSGSSLVPMELNPTQSISFIRNFGGRSLPSFT